VNDTASEGNFQGLKIHLIAALVGKYCSVTELFFHREHKYCA